MRSEDLPPVRLDLETYRRRIHHLVFPVLDAPPSAPARRVPAKQRAPFHDLLGAVLTHDLVAPVPLPLFDNSQMDGYAVHAEDLVTAGPGTASVQLPVVATIPAGVAPAPLQPGTVAAIMTGAVVPDGATAIVPVEDAAPATFAAGIPEEVSFTAPVQPGAFIRAAGSDVQAGAVIARAGQRLTPRLLGVCAAFGLDPGQVLADRAATAGASGQGRLPRVLVVSTGDEVQVPGSVPAEELVGTGRIFDANTTLLAATLTDYGCDVVVGRPSTDDPAQFIASLRGLIAELGPELIISSGGVSEGAFEVVKLALESHGVSFCKVAMQPGGPQGSGLLRLPGASEAATAADKVAASEDPAVSGTAGLGPGIPFLALPGNPVSCWISVEALLRPVLVAAGLTRLDGTTLQPREEFTATLDLDAEAEPSPPKLWQLRRARVAPGHTGHGWDVRLIAGPSSHLLTALAQANALVPVPVGVDQLRRGQTVTGWHLENG